LLKLQLAKVGTFFETQCSSELAVKRTLGTEMEIDTNDNN